MQNLKIKINKRETHSETQRTEGCQVGGVLGRWVKEVQGWKYNLPVRSTVMGA